MGDIQRFQLGDLRITALSDGTVPQDLHELLRGITPREVDDLIGRAFLKNPVEASINAYLFETADGLALVDTGAGEVFGPGMGGRLVDSLAVAGVEPSQIRHVLITHVHSDHSGGLVVGGRPLFPKAVIHVGKPDVDFFLGAKGADRLGYADQYFAEAETALRPYLDQGRLKTFEDGEEILPGVTAAIHPGHTPGSAFFTVRNGEDAIIFIGDAVHVNTVQLPRPGVTIVYDVVPDQASAVRRQAFDRFAQERTLVAAPHLPFPGIGRLRRDGDGFAWVPAEYVDRD
ncbi:MAG: MBL fold metallo-hydrolase [Pseudomonadota bacterium]|nr:MBL fold metallo-hydrolase [Pseudomonadota bacterium]